MKACVCGNFNEKAAGDAIRQAPTGSTAEDMYISVRGRPPQCGGCMPMLQVLISAFEQTKELPLAIAITKEAIREAVVKLGTRYKQEIASGADVPDYKRKLAKHALAA